MSEALTSTQKDYLREQLQYDFQDHLPPSNTLAVHQLQHELIIRAVARYAAAHEVHMLDVGCGWGDFSNKLDLHLKSYVGIEPSPIELGRHTRRPNRFLVRGVGESMDFLKDNSRNFILLNSVLDHCYDWRRTFANCMRVLAPGGLVIISMENSQKWIVRLRHALGRHHVHEGHLEFFGLDDTKKMLRPDFEIQEDCTLGYLAGMHQLTRWVPIPVGPMRLVNRMVNAVMRPFAPAGGHIFFISAIRHGTPSTPPPFSAPFRCPKCLGDLAFGSVTCPACSLKLPYGPEGYLESMELNAPLKEALSADGQEPTPRKS